MKKILSILGSLGIISSSATLSSNVVSCADNSKELTFKDGKSNKDVVNLFIDKTKTNIFNYEEGNEHHPVSVIDNKLGEDYLDLTDKFNWGKYSFGNVDGQVLIFESMPKDSMEFLGKDLNEIFNEVSSLQTINETTENSLKITVYVSTIKGSKGDSLFQFSIYEFSLELSDTGKGSFFASKIFFKNIKLS
ncbi:hypothetical protein SLITO_v1c07260 [Spiroplasma litorale]|uniref:Lipoprotein n=1 Tax=Spiroplasma litorale TaxID=216942 RepID=A0A0K1W2E8_9MOLU|nr:hypothetical protein [Spiroplasma litorale]AKX34351.1 hypothetical protein SLITO_v1c07260 [Spiroplasma litorale]